MSKRDIFATSKNKFVYAFQDIEFQKMIDKIHPSVHFANFKNDSSQY